MYEYGVSFKSVRYLQDYGSFYFCSTVDVLQFFLLMTRSLRCAWTMPTFHNVSKSFSLCGLSKYVWSIPKWLIFSWLGNMLHFDTKHYGRLSHLREKYGKSPPSFCRFSLRCNTNFHQMCFFFHISRHNGNYRMIAFYWNVLCFGILLS